MPDNSDYRNNDKKDNEDIRDDCFSLTGITIGCRNIELECKIEKVAKGLRASWENHVSRKDGDDMTSFSFSFDSIQLIKIFSPNGDSVYPSLFVVAMKIKPHTGCELKGLHYKFEGDNSDNSDNWDKRKGYINFQFPNHVKFTNFLKLLNGLCPNKLVGATMREDELPTYSLRVLERINLIERRRMKGLTDDDKVGFPSKVYPFKEEELDKACEGMALPKGCTDGYDVSDRTQYHTKGTPVITVYQKDRWRLEPSEWLNDSIIEFWIKWYVLTLLG